MPLFGDWQIDWLSFWIGLTLAATVGFLLFRWRRKINAFRNTMQESYRTAVEALTSTAAQGYRADLLRWSQTSHILSHLFTLDEILQAPRFLAAFSLLDPSQPDEYDSPELFPYTADWPQLTEAYGSLSLPLEQLLKWKTHTVLVGLPGCGRTTALAAMATEWLHRSSAQTPDLPRSMFYICAHDLALPAPAKDPLAPLVAAVQHQASSLASSQIPGYLRGALRGEGAVLLLDAVDELPFPAQAVLRDWLQQLSKQYPRVRIVATISVEELARWLPLGYVAVSPAPWSNSERHAFLQRLGGHWAELVVADRKQDDSPDPDLIIGWISRQTFSLTPFDLALRAWAAFSSDLQGNSPTADRQSYIARHMPAVAEEAMAQVCRQMIAENLSSPTRRLVENALATSWPRSDHPLPPVEDFFDDLVTAGVLRRRSGGRVSFGHFLIAAHLAGKAIASEENIPSFLAASQSPLAELSAASLAAQGDAATLVSARLAPVFTKDEPANPAAVKIPPAIEEVYKILSMCRWLRDSPSTAPWRVDIMRRLMKILRAPSQPIPLRARVLCAFLASGDTSAIQLFRQLLSAPDSDTMARVLSALGLGVMADPASVPALVQLMDSELRELRWAGALALGRIASPQAMEALGHTLLNGEDDLRRAVGEALAIDPLEGHAMLREAVLDAEVLVRRAAVFGLARTHQPWALEILEKLEVEDAQWVVKSAAGQAVERLHGEAIPGLQPIPVPSNIPWLVAFAARQKTGLAPGAPALSMLQRVVKEGTPAERAAAVQMLGALGDRKYLTDLDIGLADGELRVRDIACEALWSLQVMHTDAPK
jgi:HEAT repeat protein